VHFLLASTNTNSRRI